jgi:hypothetical protein
VNREEFFTALKERALELARAGDLAHAVSMVAIEAAKREETHLHHATVLAGHMLALQDDSKGVIAWIGKLA